MIEIVEKDALSTHAAAVLLAIDGALVVQRGQQDRMLGRLARQLLRAYPDCGLLEALEPLVRHPLPLGRALAVPLDDGPFAHAVLASTLHHGVELEALQRTSIVRSAMSAAVAAALTCQAPSMVATVMQGGWRLGAQDALETMLSGIPRETRLHLRICVVDPEHASTARRALHARGHPQT